MIKSDYIIVKTRKNIHVSIRNDYDLIFTGLDTSPGWKSYTTWENDNIYLKSGTLIIRRIND